MGDLGDFRGVPGLALDHHGQVAHRILDQGEMADHLLDGLAPLARPLGHLLGQMRAGLRPSGDFAHRLLDHVHGADRLLDPVHLRPCAPRGLLGRAGNLLGRGAHLLGRGGQLLGGGGHALGLVFHVAHDRGHAVHELVHRGGQLADLVPGRDRDTDREVPAPPGHIAELGHYSGRRQGDPLAHEGPHQEGPDQEEPGSGQPADRKEQVGGPLPHEIKGGHQDPQAEDKDEHLHGFGHRGQTDRLAPADELLGDGGRTHQSEQGPDDEREGDEVDQEPHPARLVEHRSPQDGEQSQEQDRGEVVKDGRQDVLQGLGFLQSDVQRDEDIIHQRVNEGR